MTKIFYEPIGIIHTPYKSLEDTPHQPKAGRGSKGHVVLHPKFIDGLKDLEDFSHIYLLYHLHLSQGYSLEVKPHRCNTLKGVFATRSPKRPNSIGLSIVQLERIDGDKLYIKDLDMIDGTPLLDIKPYIPEPILESSLRLGWLTEHFKNEI